MRFSTTIGLLVIALLLVQQASNAAFAMTERDKANLALINKQIAKTKTSWLYVQRTGVYQNNKQWKPAQADIDAAIKLEPRKLMFHQIRRDLLVSQNKYRDLVGETTTIMKIVPRSDKEYVSALTLRAACYKRLGDKKKAAKDLLELKKRRRH